MSKQTFSYSIFSEGDKLNQYYEYLENQSLVGQKDFPILAIRQAGENIGNELANQSSEIQNKITTSSENIRGTILDISDSIDSALDYGFNEVNFNLERIKNGLVEISSLVGFGFSMMAESQKITNDYLGNIQNLLRLPDSQKERVYHIEEGLKFLHNAENDKKGRSSEFYKHALDEFNEAKGGEHKEVKDFITLYYIGFVHLYSTYPNLLNAPKAEICFRESAKFYLAEHAVYGTNFSNNLWKSKNSFISNAFDAYLHAGHACYVQEKYSEAASLAAEAWATLPAMTKAGFYQAKYLVKDKQPEAAVKLLKEVIRQDRYLFMNAKNDEDCNTSKEILYLLNELKNEAVKEAKENFDLCDNEKISNSAANNYLSSIKDLIEKDSFLEAKEANDLLLISKKWKVPRGAHFNQAGQVLPIISPLEFTGTVIDFIKFETERVLAIPKAQKLIRIVEIEIEKVSINYEIKKLISNRDAEKDKHKTAIAWLAIGLVLFIIIMYGVERELSNNYDTSHPTSWYILIFSGLIFGVYWAIKLFSAISSGDKFNSLIKSKENAISKLNTEIETLQ